MLGNSPLPAAVADVIKSATEANPIDMQLSLGGDSLAHGLSGLLIWIWAAPLDLAAVYGD